MRLASKLRKNSRAIVRSVYLRIPFLRPMRIRYLGYKSKMRESFAAMQSSSDNLLSLQEMAQRRDDEQAIRSAMPAPPPVVWPEIDVSVVTYNSARWVNAFVESLRLQEFPLEKIHLRFVDNGSNDKTVENIENATADFRDKLGSFELVKQKNLGFGSGHDRAIQNSKSPFILVTNIDLEFEKDSICRLVRTAINDGEKNIASWEARQAPYEHPKFYDPVTLETQWSSHACILIRRSAYHEVGGYDPEIFMYAEDVELSFRFRSFGYKLKYVPSAVVSHYTYKSSNEIKPLQFAGSILGNAYIRQRYGNRRDKLIGVSQYMLRFILPSPFAGAKKLLLRNALKFTRNLRHFSRGKGPVQAHFPLRGFDYEMRREGAFHSVIPVTKDSTAELVTVIIRTYQGRSMMLAQAIQSVFNQTYSSIELVVVEDGGKTQAEVVAALKKHAPATLDIQFVPIEKLGRSAAGNAGLATARGHFVMFLDDDDLLFADHVETLIGALRNEPEAAAAYSLSMEVHTDIAPDKSSYTERFFNIPNLFFQEWDYETLLDHNFIPIQSILFKRSLYVERGGFDTNLDQLEDWNLWLRYGFENRFLYVPKTTSLFRSPADEKVRTARHALLHQNYVAAKKAAMEKCRQAN
jgi:GT2 family glycosyltransferase